MSYGCGIDLQSGTVCAREAQKVMTICDLCFKPRFDLLLGAGCSVVWGLFHLADERS